LTGTIKVRREERKLEHTAVVAVLLTAEYQQNGLIILQLRRISNKTTFSV